MKNSYKTSLYTSTISKGTPSFHEVRTELWNSIKNNLANAAVRFDDEKKLIAYGNTNINYSILYTTGLNEKAYLVAFRPCGNVNAFGKASLQQSESVLAFCNLLGEKIQIFTNPPLLFSRQTLANNDKIDISYWEIDCPYSAIRKKNSLLEFRNSAIDNAVAAIPRNNEIYVFSDTYQNGTGAYQTLRNKLSIYGNVRSPEPISKAKWILPNISQRAKYSSIFVFLENQIELEKYYVNDKIIFDSNSMPTQYVRANTVEGKFPTLPGVRANFILEMLTKMGKQPVKLIAPDQIFVNDGFLCLSDVETVSNRLFGAIFTYAKQGLETLTEEVHIYDDIKFSTPNDYSIELSEDSIPRLADNVSTLVGRNSIDILLTRRWRKESIEKLISLLRRKNIVIKRVYYISSRTCRFVDDYLLDPSNLKSLHHPFLIFNEKVAFLKACTEVRVFNNLFSLFIELQYPDEGKMRQEDLEKLLWLTKKRIYRIQEFSVLKNPEPIYVFKNLKKMYVSRIWTRNTIPLRLLI